MLKNYFIIAIRHLLRHKQSSILNVSCLIVGITFFLIIGDYIIQQVNVDSDIRNVENQFILKSKWKQEGMGPVNTTLGPLAKTLSEEFPGLVANYYRFDPVAATVSVGDKHFTEDISIGDTTFVSMFGFSLLHGNPKQAFPSGQSAVVTESFALKYFGKTDVVNNEITVHTRSDGGKHNFIISAVLKKMSPNSVSSFIVSNTEYQVYLPMDNNQYFQGGDKGDNWYNVFIVGMLELKPGVTPANLIKPIEQVLLKNQPVYTRDNLTIELAALKDYHLKSNNGAIWKLIVTLSLVALLTILLAAVNFINLNIGTSSYRLKEIGLRKVFGSARLQLASQFLTEALLLTVIASFFSLVLYESLLPVFSALLKTHLTPVLHFNIFEILFLLILTFITGLLAGTYPAFVFSSLKVTNSMKGKMDFSDKGVTLRQSLVVIQFTIAIIVFICALTISSQVSFLFARDVGYERDQVLVISSIPHQNDSSGVAKMERIKEQLVKMPGLKSISLSNDIPAGNDGYLNIYSGNQASPLSVLLHAADDDYAKVYGFSMKEGSFFKSDYNHGTKDQVVLNEAAVKGLGWDSADGKTIYLGAANGRPVTVVGVVKDFNFQSLQYSVRPLMVADLNEPFTQSYRYFSIKLEALQVPAALLSIENKWKEIFPDQGFEYFFMDDKFKLIYQSELQLKSAVSIATFLTLTIVFLGIVGIVTFTLAKRTKEIAVRKVLGANTASIILLLIKEHTLLIVLANIIAWPIAYTINKEWLGTYVYRIDQNSMTYAFVFGFILICASLLIALRSYKSANATPVKSLNSE